MSRAIARQATVRGKRRQAGPILVGWLELMDRYLLAIDQGTTGSTALVMGMDGRTLGRESRELPQHFPEPAWVEHDPKEIQQSVIEAVAGALRAAGISGSHIAALGITNQ